MNPRLSIILTLFNVPSEYVRECLNSLRCQTFKDFKIIVIDDCSEIDYSWIKSSNQFQDLEIIYIRNKKNLGLCKSVNKAFDLVDTEYCIRLGSDDVFNSDLLRKEVEFLERDRFAIAVCCELQKFGCSNTLIKRPLLWNPVKIRLAEEFIPHYHGWGYAGSMLFRSSALEICRINENYPICEDFDFHLQLLELGEIHSIHEPLYLYRSHGDNYCKQFKRADKNQILMQIMREHGLVLE